MPEEEPELKVHPLRAASVYIFAPLILMDTFLLIFTSTLLAESLGADPITIGIIGSIYPAVNLLCELFWGWFSDNYGRRLPLIVGGIFTVPGLLGFAFATEPWHLILTQAVRGVGGAAGVPLSKALIADLAPRKLLGERMGAWSMAAAAAPLIGFAISGILFDVEPYLPFVVAACTELTCVFLAIFAIPETIVRKKSPHKAKEPSSKPKDRLSGVKDYFNILKRRGITIGSFHTMMIQLGNKSVAAFAFPLFAVGLGLSGTQIGIVYTTGLMLLVLGSVPAGSISDRIGRLKPVLFYGFYSAIVWPLYAIVGGWESPFMWFLVVEVLANIGQTFGDPAMTAYTYEWVRPRERGRASALTEFFRDLGSVIGPITVGVVYQILDPVYAFYFAALINLITIIIIWALWKKAPSPEELGE